uniref:Uncharacterized protein n=1 Tax=Nelumbo nucifera TaxID=4432 RepID=A0A822XK47_NELNU|nr:TPA_asm: hypothetical protein HUJ06_022140 [Nelumbo nucifera]
MGMNRFLKVSSSLKNHSIQAPKQLQDPTSVYNQEAPSSSSSMAGKDMRRQEEEIPHPLQRLNPSSMSPDYSVGKNPPWGGSLSDRG